jgi:hypothetical protein
MQLRNKEFHLELRFPQTAPQLIHPCALKITISLNVHAVNNGKLFSSKAETAMPTEAQVRLSALWAPIRDC